MPKAPAPIPPGYHSVTPVLSVDNGVAALEFYSKAFGAKERSRSMGPGGKVWHAEFEIGGSIIMLSDEFPGSELKAPQSVGSTTASVWLYVPDVDATFKKAVAAGGKSVMDPQTMFWGDRFATVKDPFGHIWSIATHVEDVPPAEMDQRREAAMKPFGQGST